MTDPRRPWWYSGDEAERDEPAEPVESAPPLDEPAGHEDPPADEGGGGLDWTTLVVGAQRVVEWATERVMAPHAEHEAPAEHPECVVCRTMLLIGEGGRGTAADETPSWAGEEAADPASRMVGPGQIEWIPIHEASPEA